MSDNVPLPVLVSAPLPEITPEVVPALTVSVLVEAIATVPALRVEILALPLAVKAPPDIVEMVARPVEVKEPLENVVTLEADSQTLKKIPIDMFNRCHIIYRIQDDAVQHLKDTDTFSVDAGWYRVSQVTKCNMMHINPDNYKFDEDI